MEVTHICFRTSQRANRKLSFTDLLGLRENFHKGSSWIPVQCYLQKNLRTSERGEWDWIGKEYRRCGGRGSDFITGWESTLFLSKSAKHKSAKFLGLFHYRKSVGFLGVPAIRKYQKRKFLWLTSNVLQNTAHFCLKTIIKLVFLRWLF
jgi:hypothetical protein